MGSRSMSLQLYIVRRILQAIPLIFIIIILNFTIIHLAPGDPIFIMVGAYAPSQEYIEMMRHRYGFDKPLYEQLFIYLSRVIQGDLGYSLFYQQPVLDVILTRLPNTLLLMALQLIIASTLGIFLGVLIAGRRGTFIDHITSIVTLLGWSVPVFWLGQIVLLFFSLYLGWFPAGGMSEFGKEGDILSILYHAALPVLCMTLTWGLPIFHRLTRTNMIEVLKQNYIITARSKGLNENKVLFGHALRNALLPVITAVGHMAGFLFTGSVLTETIFAWPGAGRLVYESVLRRDYPVLMGMFFFVSICVITANLVTDTLYAFIDPRIRYER